MSSLEPVAAGFVVVPTKDRERRYVAFYLERKALPLDEALFELRTTADGRDVVLLPLRSFEAAKRVQKAFEKAARDHERAQRSRGSFGSV